MGTSINGYKLSRDFVDFSFENPSKIKPSHYALYFFAIEHCNRLGWKREFGLPTTMTMEAISIKSYNTYSKTFNELVKYGFFKLIEKSKNQYSANIIALSKNDKALDKALDKAFIKHASKRSESTGQSVDSIIKQLTNKQLNKEQVNQLRSIISENNSPPAKISLGQCPPKEQVSMFFVQSGGTKEMAERFYNKYAAIDWTLNGSKISNYTTLALNFIDTWKKNETKSNPTGNNNVTLYRG